MSAPEASGSPVSVFQGWQGLNQPTAIRKASRGLKRNLPPMPPTLISCGYDSGMTSTTNTRPSRKNNPFLPRTIIFVRTKQGMETIAKDYAPQRWVKSISKTGELTYTTDPRMARRFKSKEQASAVCAQYASAMVIELIVDTLRYTASEDDCGFTYFGFFNGKTGLNYDMNTNQPVQLPESVVRMNEILNK